VQNFKSILSNTVELGQLNVFIGENGSGKSNLLEALAVMSAAKQPGTTQTFFCLPAPFNCQQA
jgi:AAA15 family ATPase/GTPase